MSKNRRLLRAQRHLAQPITDNIKNNPRESIEVDVEGLTKTINYNGKKYKVGLKEG